MATLILGAAGLAAGTSLGGSVLGLSSAEIGRAAGAGLGRLIDARLFGQGSEPVETGRVDRFRLTGASEGAPIGRVYGQARVAGQVIWASDFLEQGSGGGGGKGAPAQPARTDLSYSVSLAVAVCEGVVTRIGRVWADGREVPAHRLNMRVYKGTDDQLPDPKIEAVEGAGQAPAYRGVAYVLFEDLPLGQFGNRVPSFSFEVSRPAGPDEADGLVPPDMARAVRGVALMPGSGEYTLATETVSVEEGYGATRLVNVNSADGRPDFVAAFDALEQELPDCGSVSLVVSWFGDDLRCGACTLQPKVEHHGTDASMPWQVSGTDRADAARVAQVDGGPVYGGTPTDQSVVQAIRHMKSAGKAVVFYPFILMDQLADNTLPDPWSGATGQPALPWRGRITLSAAPGTDGSPDGSAAAEAEVASFMGAAQPADFTPQSGGVAYGGPAEWSYRRFILHYAHLCAVAGGVDAFCIGSEMRALTQIRGASGFPAVDALRTLAGEVRAILGPACKLGYAADWSEYHGYQPAGTADKYFHLDPLWADPDIDFVGIDNYMPLADWRDGDTHADAGWGTIHDLGYLMSNVAGGEGYDFYYASPEDRDAQVRTPITDGFGTPWVWRYKDLVGWWDNYHHDRVDGAPAAEPTAWEPGSKPIWFTEFGCAAIDKGANQPNKFLDPKSSESAIPYFSAGYRDEFMQMQYLRATLGHWSDPANNPVSRFTGQRMLDMDRAHVWAWDARPYPAFPGRLDVWSDGPNHEFGHWITGRTAARPLAQVVEALCREAGMSEVDTSGVHGLVRGYSLAEVAPIRAALQPLMLAYGFDAFERDGRLVFRSRSGRGAVALEAERLVAGEGREATLERTRAGEAELAGTVRLGFIESGGSYRSAAASALHPGDSSRAVAASELALSLTRGEGQLVAERWLAEARVARDEARFALPPSREVGPGDVVRLEGADWRVDRVEEGLARAVEAVRIEPEIYRPRDPGAALAALPAPQVPGPVEALFLDLPLITGDEPAHAPRVAATARDWPGEVALYRSATGADFALDRLLARPATVGRTLTPLPAARPGTWDRGPALRVALVRGELASAGPDALLAGANVAAIGDGTPGNWELFQFARAELVAPLTYDLALRLRGQAGSDGLMPAHWPADSTLVLLDTRVALLDLPAASRGTLQHWRWGPADRPLDHDSLRAAAHAFAGNGLRPYPVAHLAAAVSGGDVALSWVRRTRIDGDGWEGREVPLGEADERYLVRVSEAGVLRREAEVDAPAWSYDAATRAADGLAGAAALEMAVAQLSERYGPGPFRSLEVAL
ncbi:hypothetical protein OG2516_04219 [Oceanicola granulosus HTCC2516]|uniref:Host specificity protein n=1 Tax=Oceanicola granulosus (strain ATCC BAA-861 / DSM 15982 / KCTC 12143 / HTCC2516) TaxID=314256 RepID=Q2CEC5_OCEGH|nr:glycoside hydrolase TIM-barrel-like domain-containing protein [Oceanicola granulosus]EAR51072.1 hypothetical protein OG2516_04219 [Oceanicola granulosus HTCC2516]